MTGSMVEWVDGRMGVLDDLCESPIEKLLGAALIFRWRLLADEYGLGCDLVIGDGDEREASGHTAVLVCQYKAENARHDFAVLHPRVRAPFLIECDGHDFHERTKEQAARDRSRDRYALTRRRYMMRFTGSEIWRNPFGCADEVIDLVSRAMGWR